MATIEAEARSQLLASRIDMHLSNGNLSGAAADLIRLRKLKDQFADNLVFANRLTSRLERLAILKASTLNIDQIDKDDFEDLVTASRLGSGVAFEKLVKLIEIRRLDLPIRETLKADWATRNTGLPDSDATRKLARLLDSGSPWLSRNEVQASRLYSSAYRLYLSEACDGSRYAAYQLGVLSFYGIDGSQVGCTAHSLKDMFITSEHWFRRAITPESSDWIAEKGRHDHKPDGISIAAIMFLLKIESLNSGHQTDNYTRRILRLASADSAPAKMLAFDYLKKSASRVEDQTKLLEGAENLGSEEAAFKLLPARLFATRGDLQWLNLEQPALLQSLVPLKEYNVAIFVRGLVRICLIDDADIDAAIEDFEMAFSKGYIGPFRSSIYAERLTDREFLSKVSNIGKCIRTTFLNVTDLQRIRVWILTKFRLRFHRLIYGHYDAAHLAANVIIGDKFCGSRDDYSHWIQFISWIGDLLDSPSRRFLNQLAIDAQVDTVEFSGHFPNAPLKERSKFILSKVASSTQDIGLCQNERDVNGLPLFGTWRKFNVRKDSPGWIIPPIVRISPRGIHFSEEPQKLSQCPLLLKEDYQVFFCLAMNNISRIQLSLESIGGSGTSNAWKFARKEFDPPWIAATSVGRTLYYADSIHLQDDFGRTNFSMLNARLSSEYREDWRPCFPWSHEHLGGAVAWDADCTRSAIYSRSAHEVNAKDDYQNEEIVVASEIDAEMYFDTSSIRSSDDVRTIGAGNPRYASQRSGAYMSERYDKMEEACPVFQRMRYLNAIYKIMFGKLRRSSLVHNLRLKRHSDQMISNYESRKRQVYADNPHMIVFDLR